MTPGAPLRVYALHGFLGKPSDWEGIAGRIASRSRLARPVFVAVDPSGIARPRPGLGLRDWGRAFSAGAERDLPVLLGYSQGGRLAMHALVEAPRRWRAAVLVSAHPGLPEGEREPRIARDEAWASAFETRPWDEVTRVWASQPAFAGREPPWTRLETDFDRRDLAGALREWSLGRQEDLFPFLAGWERPIAWIAGEDDPRYVEIGRRLHAARRGAGLPSELMVEPGAGHRVPWEAPGAFAERVAAFLDGLG